jgi:hypothetical protein
LGVASTTVTAPCQALLTTAKLSLVAKLVWMRNFRSLNHLANPKNITRRAKKSSPGHKLRRGKLSQPTGVEELKAKAKTTRSA